MNHPHPVRRLDSLLLLIKKKNKNKTRHCQRVDFLDSVDPRVDMNESENIDKYLDHVNVQKKSWNMNVTVMSAVIGALWIIEESCYHLISSVVSHLLQTIREKRRTTKTICPPSSPPTCQWKNQVVTFLVCEKKKRKEKLLHCILSLQAPYLAEVKMQTCVEWLIWMQITSVAYANFFANKNIAFECAKFFRWYCQRV